MQIIIPMSGFGERFRKAGYSVPKPLIEIDGKPIIGHVIDMLPGERDFIFVCNQDHLDEPSYLMREILTQYCPQGRVIGIPAHKSGPIHAVNMAREWIKPDSPVVVNYCDFTCYWDWSHFKQWVAELGCAGAVPAYRGFHPHTLGTTNYAYLRENGGLMLDIQEKQPYTDNRMEEYASSGTYYFSSGQLMLKAFEQAVAQDLNINGEFYVSLAYKPLLVQKLLVGVYDLQHFMQWGTPADVSEYLGWSTTFRDLNGPASWHEMTGSLVVPMAGMGQRLAQEGYALTKPLIPVSGKSMVLQAANYLPEVHHYAFVMRTDMPGFETVSETLRTSYPGTVIHTVAQVTEGQACTAMLGLDALEAKVGVQDTPVTFGACDYGALYDVSNLRSLLADGVDVVVWAIRGHAHAIRNPHMYGWIRTEGQYVTGISVKVALDSPSTDPIVLGTFTFKDGATFRRCVERMIARDARVNGEFYLDTCINDALELGLCCKIFEVDHFMSWGTPDDLRTFEYWQSCFHKWAGHPYRLENDGHVPPNQLGTLERRYATTVPQLAGAKVLIKREISIFLVVGLITVVIDFCVYCLFLWTGALDVATAKTVSFLLGTVFAYGANKIWTFRHTQSGGSVPRFAVLYASTLGINVCINAGVLNLAGGSQLAFGTAFFFATGSSAVLNFLGMKFFVFKPSKISKNISTSHHV